MNWASRIETALSKLEKLFFKPEVESGRRWCVSMNDTEARLVCIEQNKKNIDLVTLDSLSYESKEASYLAISDLFAKHSINFDPIYWLLNPSQYQMLVIDSLPKDPRELDTALNWRVRNLINYPIDQAASDYFTLPPNRSTKNNVLVAASVAKKASLLEMINFFEENNLNLTKIDVPEISMRNITARDESHQKSTALLFFYEHSAILNITNQKQIYFTRHIDLISQPREDKERFNNISLEILRLLDYFQSQWRLPSPTKLFINGVVKNKDYIAKQLAENLLMSVEVYELNTDIFSDNSFEKSINDYIPEIGCALSEMENHENTID